MKFALAVILWTAIAILPAQVQKNPAPPQGIVHIYREKLEIGKVVRPTVSCDNFPVVRIPNGSIFTMKMSAGRHAITTSDEVPGIHIDVEAGKEHYIRIDFPANASHATGAAAVLVPVEQGRMETKKLRVLDASYVESAVCGS